MAKKWSSLWSNLTHILLHFAPFSLTYKSAIYIDFIE